MSKQKKNKKKRMKDTHTDIWEIGRKVLEEDCRQGMVQSVGSNWVCPRLGVQKNLRAKPVHSIRSEKESGGLSTVLRRPIGFFSFGMVGVEWFVVAYARSLRS